MATTITSSVIVDGLGILTPNKWLNTRSVTSRISAARSCMYGLSSIASNIPMNMPATSESADSALTPLSRMLAFIDSIISGSDNTIKCASKTCASSSPSDTAAFSRIALTSDLAVSKLSKRRATSPSESSTLRFSKDRSGSVSKYAFAIAIPSLAAIPCKWFFILLC